MIDQEQNSEQACPSCGYPFSAGHSPECAVNAAKNKNVKETSLVKEDDHSDRIEAVRIEDDLRYKDLLEKESLKYLQTKDAKWFLENYSGERAPSGYLIDKLGKETNNLPSQCITGGWAEVQARARQEFVRQYPKDAKQFQIDIKQEWKPVVAETRGARVVKERKINEEPLDRKVAVAGVIGAYRDSRYGKPAVDVDDKSAFKQKDYLGGVKIDDLVAGEGEDLGLHEVDDDVIVGSVSGVFENWGSEYETRKGRVGEIARSFVDDPIEVAEHVFHTEDSSQRIKLKRVQGPEGPIFFVKDGTHRVAAAKLAELPKILADVEGEAQPEKITTKDKNKKEHWKKMISVGLMNGAVTEEAGGSYRLHVSDHILPWCLLKQHDFIDANKIYNRAYPGALSRLKNLKTGEPIPEEALVDELALNFYLSDRWSDYKQMKRSK